ncbi:MAG: hypothetical protein EOO88_30735 [Pedobacter sp.]|nr:MAG: hypothetical protein EOO88_30735 [Pedobacter sp.]
MKKESNSEENKSTVMFRLNQKMRFCQRGLADHLNVKCRNISSKTLLAMLVIFTALVSAILLRLIISAIQ